MTCSSAQAEEPKFRETLQGLDPPEIADIINGVGGMAWHLGHDAADGRIEDNIDEDLKSLHELVQIAAEVFANKVGVDIKDANAMRSRIKEELAKFEQLLAELWEKISQVGAVFCLTDEPEDLFETVAAYQTRYVSGKEAILVRIHGSGLFSVFHERDSQRLTLVDAESLYTDDSHFLRSTAHGLFPRTLKCGHDIRESGAVFAYQGDKDDPRNGTYEAFHIFYIPGSGREEVVIARDQNRPMVAEFTAADLPKIRISDAPRKWIVRGENYTYTPELDIFAT